MIKKIKKRSMHLMATFFPQRGSGEPQEQLEALKTRDLEKERNIVLGAVLLNESSPLTEIASDHSPLLWTPRLARECPRSCRWRERNEGALTPEYKAEAVRLGWIGDRSNREIAKALDPTKTALREWAPLARRTAPGEPCCFPK